MADDAELTDPVEVAEAGQLYQAELMALRLRAHGLDAHVIDQTFQLEPIPNVRSFAVVRVMVPRAQADEARRILAAADPLSAEDDDSTGNREVM
jgi:hypothetical protein